MASKKEIIFQLYAENLKLLIDNELIDKQPTNELIYICPICLREFSSIDEPGNQLTLEHVPPDALGGKANILTCEKCNSEAGYKIDVHLIERMRQLDKQEFRPGTEMKITVKIGGETFRGTIVVEENGETQIQHSNLNNHPEKLAAAMKLLKAGSKLDADFVTQKIIPENLEYALLKTGYLLLFQKYGYSLILDKCFDNVRAQIQNPQERIYPEGFWMIPPYSKEMSGVYFIKTPTQEAMLSIFNVDTGQSEKLFATILPLPIRPVSDVIILFNTKVEQDGEHELMLSPKDQKSPDYLKDLPKITEMLEWINKRGAEA